MISADFGLLLIRLVIGGLMIGHGSQKLFGWFGGYGFSGTSGFFGSMLRLQPAKLWTAAAGLGEAGGGLLLVLGFLTPLGATGVVAAMVMAAILAHWPRFWNTDSGIEYPAVLATTALAVALTGPGAISLDAALGIALPEPITLAGSLAGAAVTILVALATRTPAIALQEVSESEVEVAQAA